MSVTVNKGGARIAGVCDPSELIVKVPSVPVVTVAQWARRLLGAVVTGTIALLMR